MTTQPPRVAAPTAAADTNTTQLATTAFVLAQAASVAPLINGTAAVGTSLRPDGAGGPGLRLYLGLEADLGLF